MSKGAIRPPVWCCITLAEKYSYCCIDLGVRTSLDTLQGVWPFQACRSLDSASNGCSLQLPCLPAPDVSILGSYCPDLLQFSLSTSRGFGEVAIKGTMLNPAWGRNVLLGKVRYFRDMQHPGKCNILKSDMSGEHLGNNPENLSRKLFKFKTSPFVVSQHIRIEKVKCRTQF